MLNVLRAMVILYLISGILLMASALFFCYRPLIPASLLSYVAMWILGYSEYATFSKDTLIFWGMATIIVLIINSSQAHNTSNSNGTGYITSGSFVGCIVGMLTSHAGIILGAALGAIAGFVAYCHTPKGSAIKLPSKEFISQLAAKGLPTVVTMSTIGTTLDSLLNTGHLN